MPHKTHKVTIIGAGMAGSLLAILLARRGYTVELAQILLKAVNLDA